jgi:TolA-binding protein
MHIPKSLIFAVLFIVFFPFLSNSQNTLSYTKNESHYRDGLEYFERSNYAAAKMEFAKYLDNSESAEKYHNYDQISAEYYVVVCNLYLEAPEADIQANRFVAEHPNHPKSATLFKELGNFYFASQNYEKAIYNFKKVNRKNLTIADQSEVGFKLGMAYYNSGELKNALEQFLSVKNLIDDEYSPQATYYAGVIEFKQESYDNAIRDFKNIEKNENYKAEAPIWIANSYYKQDKLDELLAYAGPLLKPTNREKYVGELSVLVADIYFQKADYQQAATYYDLLKKVSKAPITPDIRYRMGYSQYKLKRFTEATENLKLVATRNDDLGQYASYYLGVSYLNTQNLSGALAGFDAARRMSFNPGIKEDAAFNHAKVQISMGNSTAAIKELLEFSKAYPNSTNSTEVSELLTDAYLTSNNYQAAINYIESLKNRTPKINLIYQRMTYNQGISEFNAENFPKSIFYFIKSVQNPEDLGLKIAADYYKAESFYLQKKYSEALPIYNELQTVSETSKGAEYGLKALYSMAYIYYNQANYEKAATLFKSFTDKLKDDKVRPNYDDAMVRLADCYFVQKNFTAASQIYDIVALGGLENKDYALYQKAQTLQFQGKDDTAKEVYNRIIKDFPSSTFSDDALYKAGEIELNSDNYAVAVSQFSKLIQTKQKSNWVPNAYLKRAIANTNLKNNDAAITDFRTILNTYSTHAVSEDALLGLQDVLNTVGRSDEFSADLAAYKQKNPEGSSTENLEFETAKNIYFAFQYAKAIPALTNFIKNYPNSSSLIEATYCLADSYNRTNDRQNALKYFYNVISAPSSNYLSRAAFRAAEIENTLKNYPKAIGNYKLWAQTSNSKVDQQKSYLGIMEGYFALKNYDSVLVASREVINMGNVIANSVNKGTLYSGKAYYGKNDPIRATVEFENTIKLAKDEYGAEAKYNLALISFDSKNYKQTIELCKQLNSDFSDYEQWRGKGFLLIADCYIATEDTLNAKAVLNSIIDNSPDTELVVLAKQRLSNIK